MAARTGCSNRARMALGLSHGISVILRASWFETRLSGAPGKSSILKAERPLEGCGHRRLGCDHRTFGGQNGRGPVRTVGDLRIETPVARRGERIALVPTMGSLHAGHLSLVGSPSRMPTASWPRSSSIRSSSVRRKISAAIPATRPAISTSSLTAGADLVFAPDVARDVSAGLRHQGQPAEPHRRFLRRPSRPNHFDGVATVVTKLLLQCAPDTRRSSARRTISSFW